MGFCYLALLSKEKVLEFLAFFYELEASKHTTVKVNPLAKGSKFEVSLTPQQEVTSSLLESSFREGLLAHRGWDQKFARQPV